jgi:hydroxyacylglutathione hydrolase
MSKRASVKDLAARLNGAPDAPLVLDVRQHDEYAAGHIPGAVHLMGGELPDRLSELPRDRPIVTICEGGYRSAVAAGLLARAGFRDVASIDTGVPAWRRAGLPIERGD